MATLGKVVYLTEAQYTTLKTNGSITVGGVTVTYSDNDIYVTPQSGSGGAVESVNGQTGVVVLTASDVGAGTYSKPSGGIPASDLASGVIPTVPSAYTSNPAALGTASAGSSTNWAKGDHVHPMPSAADVGALPNSKGMKNALMNLFKHVSYTDENGPSYINALAALLGVKNITNLLGDVSFTSGFIDGSGNYYPATAKAEMTSDYVALPASAIVAIVNPLADVAADNIYLKVVGYNANKEYVEQFTLNTVSECTKAKLNSSTGIYFINGYYQAIGSQYDYDYVRLVYRTYSDSNSKILAFDAGEFAELF